jgi:hypothetical protein
MSWWEGRIRQVGGLWQCGECGRRYLKFGEAKDCLELHDAYNTSFSFSERVDNMNRLFDHYKKAVSS